MTRTVIPNWTQTRKAIVKRDNEKCKRCGSAYHLEVHHIVAKFLGGDESESNLITLCFACHREREYYEQVHPDMTFDTWLGLPSISMFYNMYMLRTYDGSLADMWQSFDEQWQALRDRRKQ